MQIQLINCNDTRAREELATGATDSPPSKLFKLKLLTYKIE